MYKYSQLLIITNKQGKKEKNYADYDEQGSAPVYLRNAYLHESNADHAFFLAFAGHDELCNRSRDCTGSPSDSIKTSGGNR